eukprot:5210700-Prymnesium_polylepis.1
MFSSARHPAGRFDVGKLSTASARAFALATAERLTACSVWRAFQPSMAARERWSSAAPLTEVRLIP